MDSYAIKLERLQRELERRQHIRIPVALRVHWENVDDGRTGTADLVSLGLGGARIDFDEEVHLPAVLVVTLPQLEKAPTVRAPILEAHLTWTVADRRTPPFPAGLQFPTLTPEMRKALFVYVAAVMED